MRICENNVKGSSTYLPHSSGISIGAFSVTSLALFPFLLHSYILLIRYSSTFLQQNLFYLFLVLCLIIKQRYRLLMKCPVLPPHF